MLKRLLNRQTPDEARYHLLAKRLESPIEQLFWEQGYKPLSKLGRFTPQVTIGRYRADFVLTDIPGVELLKVVIELDGHDNHSNPDQRDYDTSRDRALLKAGWLVVRFTGSQINRDCAGRVKETVDLVRVWVWARRLR